MWAPHDKTRPKGNLPAARSRVPMISAGIIGVLCGLGMLQLARQVPLAGPIVGDIISFAPDPSAAGEPAPRLTAYRPGEGQCVLDVQAIRRSGGSLIVEMRQLARDPVYRVHWSGLRTTGDQGNCGADADLVLRGSDLDLLAQAAGGYGVDAKRYVAQTVMTSPGSAIP